MAGSALPQGYTRFAVRQAEIVARLDVADDVRAMLGAGTLYDYGARHPHKRALDGRGTVYAVALPSDSQRVVIRHNRHGGLFAPMTSDLFLPPTRAPYELAASEHLRSLGVATPVVLAYATYPARLLWRRADVATGEIPNSFDLSVALRSMDSALRASALDATGRLVRDLGKAGVRHHDLNIKNILLHPAADPSDGVQAVLLDVDRVAVVTGDPTELNLTRLLRSVSGWRSKFSMPVTEAELRRLADQARDRSH